jgi:hypothetical protein
VNRVTAIAGLAGFVLTGLLAAAQQPAPEPSPQPKDEGVGVHFPHTAEDHLALAADYTRKAEERRKEADLHRRMLAAYEGLARDLATQPAPPRKRGMTFPSEKRAKPSKDPVAEYRGHCQTYTHGAEKLADEADKLAESHRAWARELRGAKDP